MSDTVRPRATDDDRAGNGMADDARLRPLSAFPAAERRHIRIVLTDIDDTLTLDGRLPALAYGAMERLRQAGLLVVPVTGRPAGWCDLIARLWPVDGVVGENGAFYFRHDPDRGMVRVFAKRESERRADRKRLEALAAAILERVPGARIAADQLYRESDLAIDYAEDGPVLPKSAVDRIVACFHEAGATARVSSIHVNGWYGEYDKLTMTRRLLADIWNIAPPEDRRCTLFVGDSPNDEPMFGYFRHGVAVANFAAFADQVRQQPRWLASRRGGEGFAEVAEALLEARA